MAPPRRLHHFPNPRRSTHLLTSPLPNNHPLQRLASPTSTRAESGSASESNSGSAFMSGGALAGTDRIHAAAAPAALCTRNILYQLFRSPARGAWIRSSGVRGGRLRTRYQRVFRHHQPHAAGWALRIRRQRIGFLDWAGGELLTGALVAQNAPRTPNGARDRKRELAARSFPEAGQCQARPAAEKAQRSAETDAISNPGASTWMGRVRRCGSAGARRTLVMEETASE